MELEKFAYEILMAKHQEDVPGGIIWFLSSNMNQPVGSNLLLILNQLGQNGWEVAGVGDVSFDARSDIILKKRIS